MMGLRRGLSEVAPVAADVHAAGAGLYEKPSDWHVSEKPHKQTEVVHNNANGPLFGALK
jgi:hypothetical protein